MVRWQPIVAGVAVGTLALVGFVTNGYYPPALGPTPASAMRGVVAGVLAGLVVGGAVGPDVREAARYAVVTTVAGLALAGAAYLLLAIEGAPMVIGVFVLASAVPAALTVVAGSTVAAAARGRIAGG